MTASTRTLPDHGTTARAKTNPRTGVKGCNLPCCRTARNRYDKRARYLNATGRTLRVPAEPVATHIRHLLASDASWRQIAEDADVSRATIHGILNGRQIITRRVAERILAVEPRPAERSLVDAVGAIRRVRALTALGHPSNVIAAAGAVERSAVSLLLNGQRAEIRYGTHQRVVAAYGALSMTTPAPGPASARARNRGRREGWAPPLAWGDDIDSADAVPDCGEAGNRTAALLEDAEFIQRTTGADLDAVAQRLGVKRGTLEKARERAAARATGTPA